MPPSDATLIEGWDAGAGRYDAMTECLERRFLAASRRWIGQRAVGDVLEVAIGTGANLDHYATDVRLTGLDWSSGMLDLARVRARRLGRGVSLLRGDAASLPFADASFDTVTATFAMCSVPDIEGALRESLRVLRPQGTLLLADHVRGRWPLSLVQRLLDAITVPLQGEYWTRRPMLLLRQWGVEVTEAERTTFGAIERLSARRPDGVTPGQRP